MLNEKRLIDAYKLEDLLRSNSARYHNKDDVIAAIAGQPTVDAVEVVHGHWIEKPTGAYGRWQSWCSACGKHSGIGGIKSNRHKPYCPNCGAKMDGDGNENGNT